MANQISHIQTMEALRDALQCRLEKVGVNRNNLVARVMLVNHYILATLWYLLTLWPGDAKDMEDFQWLVRKFIWT